MVVEVTLANGTQARLVVRRPRRDTPEASRQAIELEQRMLSCCARLGLTAPKALHLDVAEPALVLGIR